MVGLVDPWLELASRTGWWSVPLVEEGSRNDKQNEKASIQAACRKHEITQKHGTKSYLKHTDTRTHTQEAPLTTTTTITVSISQCLISEHTITYQNNYHTCTRQAQKQNWLIQESRKSIYSKSATCWCISWARCEMQLKKIMLTRFLMRSLKFHPAGFL